MKKFWPVPEWISTYSYKQSPRSFGSKRSAGRTHAGCDLYAPLGSPVLAIAAGRVIESWKFYSGTFQVTVDHGALGVVRYGEVEEEGIPSVGTTVQAGEQIGRIGNLGRGLHPMLHLEHYSGQANGPLSNFKNPPYLRRSDLQDATLLLDSLLCLRDKTCTKNQIS
ncbi:MULTISPECIES: M23 family metallopeptidase [Limnobacter]|uniref:M23 family metallopeptidase n=1 Tax=Limnobacter TaxID=131079 RepID=UPI00351C108F